MKRGVAVSIALLALLAGAPAARADEPAVKPTPAPFYRKYLVSGNKLDDEIMSMEQKVAENPDDATLHNDFGNLLALRRFPEQAAEQYELASKLDKADFISYYNLGILRETEGKMSEAISAYKKSISRKPGFPPSRFRLGRAYELKGELDEAAQQYAKALWIDPSMRDPKRNPLVIDSRIMYRASLMNYERDMAKSTLDRDVSFIEVPAFRKVPVDRALASEEVDEAEAEPAPREIGPGGATGVTTSSAPPGTAPGRRPAPRATGATAPANDAPMRPRPTPRPSPRMARPGQPVAPAPAPAPRAVPPEPTAPPDEPGNANDPAAPETVPESAPTPGPAPDEIEPS